MESISFDDFKKVQLRVGTIIEVLEFKEARIPAYKIKVDLGDEIGIKKSSAQITKLYNKEELIGKQVMCVVNFPPKQVGPFMSEVLITGIVQGDEVVLVSPDRKVSNGLQLA